MLQAAAALSLCLSELALLGLGSSYCMPLSFSKTVGSAGYMCLCCGCLTWECSGGLAVPFFKGCAVVTGCAGHKPLCSFRFLGQINTTDFFTRLLAGITFTGLAPASFYKDPSGPDRHFDGMCATWLLSTAK